MRKLIGRKKSKHNENCGDSVSNYGISRGKRRALTFAGLGIGSAVLCLIASVGSLTVLFKNGFKCVFRTLTGVPCPGCGMTRAMISVLKLELSEAFYYHPLFCVPPLMLAVGIVALLCKNKSVRRVCFIIFMALCAAMAVCWGIRLACGWTGE